MKTHKKWLSDFKRPTIVGLTVGALALTGCAGDEADDFPNRTITMIVPYAAGGGTDLAARTVAEAASESLGQQITVENQPGGDSIPGMQQAAQADPDGYTIVMTATPLVAAQFTADADIRPSDFDQIATVNLDPPAITVAADAPWDTAEEYLEAAREDPGNMRIGVTPPSGAWNVAAEVLQEQADVDLNTVVFSDGAAPAVTALLGGDIESVGVSPGEVYEYVRSDDLKILATGGSERLPALPDVPTFDEAGVSEDFPEIGAFRIVNAPEGTPEEVIQVLEEAFVDAAESEEYIDFLEERAYGHLVMDASDSQAYLEEQEDLYQDILTDD